MIGLQDTISINKNLTMNVMTIDLNVNGVLMDDRVVCTKNGRLGKWDMITCKIEQLKYNFSIIFVGFQ